MRLLEEITLPSGKLVWNAKCNKDILPAALTHSWCKSNFEGGEEGVLSTHALCFEIFRGTLNTSVELV